ncbi:MAG TPA: hypothetical protein VG267_12850 [Terracidiphilus sp.]|jgi:hypothetical protein|nr:hypothetical protein [Terracidiphilus sp.]
MPTDSNSQLESLWDTCAGTLINTWDVYGWLIPALLLTILFFAVIAFVCWALEDVDFDLPIFEGPRCIFRWCKRRWQSRTLF